MARKARLEVEVVGDSRSLERALNRSAKAVRGFKSDLSSGVRSLGRALPGLGIAVGGVAAILAKSVEQASDLNEAVSQTNVVFGQSAKEVQAWSKTTATGLGISRQEALKTAAGFGALLRPMGIVGDTATKQARSLTELGADLASFYNTDVASALDAIRSGVVGESEPLRRYGIRLSEARVQALALAQSGKTTVKALTDQEKTLARITLIFRDSAVAQGDFARTSGGLANQMRILQALIRDTAAEIGAALLPLVLEVTRRINAWLADPGNRRQLRDTIKDVANALVSVVEAVGKAVRAIKRFWLELKAGAVQTALDIVEPFSHLPGFLGDDARRAKDAMLKEFGVINEEIDKLLGKVGLLENAPTGLRGPAGTSQKFVPPGIKGPLETDTSVASDPGVRAAKKSAAQAVRAAAALPWREFQLAVAEGTKTVADDIRVLRTIITVLTGRLANATTLKAKTEIVQALNAYRQQEAALVRGMAEAKKQLAEARRARAAERRENRQFGLLGLGPGGAELPPSLRNLRKSLGRIGEAVQGTFLDTKKTRSLLNNIRRLLSGALGALSADVRRTIKQMLDDIDQQLKEHGSRKSFRIMSTAAVVAGLGLSREQALAIRQRLARQGRGGTIPDPGPSAFGVPVRGGGGRGGRGPQERPVQVNLIVSGKTLARVILPELQKIAGTTTGSSLGRHGGRTLGAA